MLREQLAGAVGTSDFVASGKAAGGETRHRRADRVPARHKHDKQVLRPEPQRRKIRSSARTSSLLAPQVLKEARGRVSP